MIVVHYLPDSRSHRIPWLLEELGVPYEIVTYARIPNSRRAPAELKAVHPLGKAPVVADDGRIVAESGAIIDYILRRYGGGRLQPAPSDDRYSDYVYWMHASEGSVIAHLLTHVFAARANPDAPIMRRLDEEVLNQLDFLNATLAGRDYLLGDAFTAADIQLSFAGEVAAGRFGLHDFPHLASWVGRFRARPGYQAAIARGGPLNMRVQHDRPLRRPAET